MTDRITLRGRVAIDGAGTHAHAAKRLSESFPDIEWVPEPRPDYPTVRLAVDDALPEGSFSIESRAGDSPLVEVAGGPFSGVIYGVEEIIQRLAEPEDGGISLPLGTVEQSPSLPYRTWWNWDHSTNWDLDQIGVQEIGVMNPYAKPGDGFLADFERVVDFMSRNRIAAVTIYGFLRASHGGIEAAQALCRYANERGVRILPGVAINAYGGVVWEMDHEFNLATWLRKHPELAAQMEHPPGFQIQDLDFELYFPRGDYSVRGCPSQPANQDWMAEAVAWLAETFDIGGINIEAGDYGVCGCPLCQERRGEREDAKRREGYAESWSHADMADFYPRLYDAVRTRHPDAWIYSEIQWDNLFDADAMAPLRDLPEGGIYTHTLNRSYWNRVERELTAEYAAKLPTKSNVFRCQFACQWNGDRRTERYRFNGRDFEAMAKKADAVGFEGLTIWGEPSPYNTSTELSYLAHACFSWDSTLTWDEWLTRDVAPLLGGLPLPSVIS
ncbi:MAG: hypothetical protein R2848_03615 [Thermomicrobiales bacterium]